MGFRVVFYFFSGFVRGVEGFSRFFSGFLGSFLLVF